MHRRPADAGRFCMTRGDRMHRRLKGRKRKNEICVKKFEKVVDKCLQCAYNSILSSPKSERFSEAQRAGSKPFMALDALVGTENFLKKVLKSA